MIYFVQDVPGGMIKIGTTACLSDRLKSLEAEYRVKLNVLGVTDGSYADEDVLHERFRAICVGGEWHCPSEELLEFIKTDCRSWDGKDEVASARLHEDIARSARIVAAYKGSPMTDLLSEILRPILVRMEHEEVAKREKVTKPARKKGKEQT